MVTQVTGAGTRNDATPQTAPDHARSPMDALMSRPGRLERFGASDASRYTVRPGDTLDAIARRHGTSWQTLARINGIANPDVIRPGQTIQLHRGAQRTHVVQPGDTLSKIAAETGISVATLARRNGIVNRDLIHVGQVLTLNAGPRAGASQTGGTTAAAPVGRMEASSATRTDRGAHRLGAVSERYESGGRGPGTVSTGTNDPGGVSYGVYQLSSKAGTLNRFMAREGQPWAAEIGSARPGSAAFSDAWRAIARREPDAFRAAQHTFIERTHFAPAVAGVRADTGLDLGARSAAVRDVVWSVSVQHAGARTILDRAVALTDRSVQRGAAGYDEALIRNVYSERTAYVLAVASRTSNPGERAQLIGVTQNRYPNELRDALALLRAPSADQATRAPATTSAQGTAPISGAARTPADFAAIVASSGDARAQADLAAGCRVVVAVRQDTALSANGGRGAYDDRMAVVWKNPDGSFSARQFAGNADPSGRYEARGYGQDINGDGRRELGRLVEGNYRYTLQGGTFAGNRYFRVDRTQVALRDTNHDGRFTAADGIDRRGAGTSMLFHQGGNSMTGSAGCQTMNPGDYAAFLGLVAGQGSFSYVLVRVRSGDR